MNIICPFRISVSGYGTEYLSYYSYIYLHHYRSGNRICKNVNQIEKNKNSETCNLVRMRITSYIKRTIRIGYLESWYIKLNRLFNARSIIVKEE